MTGLPSVFRKLEDEYLRNEALEFVLKARNAVDTRVVIPSGCAMTDGRNFINTFIFGHLNKAIKFTLSLCTSVARISKRTPLEIYAMYCLASGCAGCSVQAVGPAGDDVEVTPEKTHAGATHRR